MTNKKMMKILKEDFKLTLSYCKDRIKNNEKLLELEELMFTVVYKNGDRIDMFRDSTYDEIKSFKTTNIVYIAMMDDCEARDTVQGFIPTEGQFDTIDANIENL